MHDGNTGGSRLLTGLILVFAFFLAFHFGAEHKWELAGIEAGVAAWSALQYFAIVRGGTR